MHSMYPVILWDYWNLENDILKFVLLEYNVVLDIMVFLVAERVKNLPATQETWVRFLDQEDPLEKGMAIHSRILAWRIPWTEEPGRQVHGTAKSRTQLSN